MKGKHLLLYGHVLTLMVLTTILAGQAPDTMNLNFENTVIESDFPEKWVNPEDKGWKINASDEYSRYGKKSMTIVAENPPSGTFGRFSQSIPAEKLVGQTIDFSGWIKTMGVQNGFAGIWMRVDAQDRTLVSDNMYDRGIRGDTDWTRKSITITVPEGAKQIVFGGLLVFDGRAWYDGFKLVFSGDEIVIEDEMTADGTNTVLLSNVHYIDVLTQKPVRNADIYIEDGIIRNVGPTGRISTDDGVRTIDLTGKWAIPGLIDGHIHLFQSGGLYARPDVVNLQAIRSLETETGLLRAMIDDLMHRYLRCGITTVIDVGGPMYNFELRNRLEGRTDMPNLIMTGPLISTYQPAAFDIEDPPIIKVQNEAQARELVRKQADMEADFIKIWYIDLPQLPADSTIDIVRATIDEANLLGLPVAVHATELNTAKLAVQAGAKYLVHSVGEPIDQEFIDMCYLNDVVLCPTLIVFEQYAEVLTGNPQITEEDFKYANPHILGTLFDTRHIKDNLSLNRYKAMGQVLMDNNRLVDSIQQDNLRRLQENGVRIASGTDAGNIGTLHASSFFEEIARMQQAGLSPMDIIVSSTFYAAAAVKQENRLGSITEDFLADLVIYGSNPAENINVLKDPLLVVKGGVVHKPRSLVEKKPDDLIQTQLNAYNMRDIEAFLSVYDNDVVVYNFPDDPMLKGIDELRLEYEAMFNETEGLHAQLVDRIYLNKTVIDHERVWFDEKEGPAEVIAIYDIEGSKIKRVYFKR